MELKINTCQDIQDHIEPKKRFTSESEVSALPTGGVRDPNLHGILGCLSVLPSCFLCLSSLCQKCVSKKWKLSQQSYVKQVQVLIPLVSFYPYNPQNSVHLSNETHI